MVPGVTLPIDIGYKYNAWKVLYFIVTYTCSNKLHLWYYLEMLWSKTGYFGLLGNNHI